MHIVDLDQTLPRFQEALDFLRETVARGGKVLFVATKRQAQLPIAQQAERSEQFYVNRRWLGGMLTNFKTVKKSIERFKELLELVADEEKSGELSKKELSRVNRWIEKYKKSLDGIKEMGRLPDALFVIDVKREAIAVKEAHRLGIPIVAIVDSNCDPEPHRFRDPRQRRLAARDPALLRARGRGLRRRGRRAQRARAGRGGRAGGRQGGRRREGGTGRVVVEIKQQPRRPRSAHSSGGEDDAKRKQPEPAAAAPETPPASE